MNLQAIHARMKKVASVTQLPFRTSQVTGTAGNVLGQGTGSSIDFQDHRQYVPGDDPRHLNWQAYARTGNYTMKLFREEITPRVDLVFDVSHSMFITRFKETRAWELFYFCLESSLRASAHLNIFVLGQDPTKAPSQVSPQQACADNWPFLMHSKTNIQNTIRNTTQEPAHLAHQLERIPFRSGSLRVLVSDLLDESPPSRSVASLGAAHSRGIILAPFAGSERDPDWKGNIHLKDCEQRTSRRQHIDDALLAEYRANYKRHFTVWRDACIRRGVGFAQVSEHGSFLEAIRDEAIPAGVLDMEH